MTFGKSNPRHGEKIAFSYDGKEYLYPDYPPFLLSLNDFGDNILKIKLALPVSGDIGEGSENEENAAVRSVLKTARPVYPDDDNLFEIVFEDYIMYNVRNESFCSEDSDESYSGIHFRIYTKSKLLGFLPEITDHGVIEALYPRNRQHYEIISCNHIIDVITANEPVVTKSRKTE